MPEVPPYINALETYIRMVARWGVLVSAQRDIGADVIRHKNLRFHAQLRRLLEEMQSREEGPKREDEIFILTALQTTKNIGTLEKHLSIPAEQCFSRPLEPRLLSLYEEHIAQPCRSIAPCRLKDYFGLDDFWNGFRHT